MKLFGKPFLILIVLLLPMGLRAGRYELNSGFDAANRLYEEGHYAEAAEAYDKLIAEGEVSAALYFNAGDAWFKLGKTGKAIAAYREAQRLAPRDRDLITNLQFARIRARGGEAYPAERWRSLLMSLSLNEWTLLTCFAVWAVLGLLTLNQWRPEEAPKVRRYLMAAGAAAVIFGIGFVWALNSDLTETAIVTSGEADVRNGPLDESQGIFKVRDGAELEVLDQKDGWLQVQDSGLRIGWIRQDQVVLFPAPVIANGEKKASAG